MKTTVNFQKTSISPSTATKSPSNSVNSRYNLIWSSKISMTKENPIFPQNSFRVPISISISVSERRGTFDRGLTKLVVDSHVQFRLGNVDAFQLADGCWAQAQGAAGGDMMTISADFLVDSWGYGDFMGFWEGVLWWLDETFQWLMAVWHGDLMMI